MQKKAFCCLGLMLARIDVVIAWQFLMFDFGDCFMARLTFHEYQVVLFIDTFKRKWMQNMNIGRIFFLSVKRDRKHSYLMYVSWIYIPHNRTLFIYICLKPTITFSYYILLSCIGWNKTLLDGIDLSIW